MSTPLSRLMQTVMETADTGKQQIGASDVSRVLRCFWDAYLPLSMAERFRIQEQARRLWKRRQKSRARKEAAGRKERS